MHSDANSRPLDQAPKAFLPRVESMDPNLLEELLNEEESPALDFKRDQYPFDGADDIAKSELLKDIIAFANAWRRTEAYILIGVEEVKGGRSIPAGVASHIDDAKLQQFVNSKTNLPIAFSYRAAVIDGVQVGVIRIEVQERPFFLRKDFGKLKAGTVYIRRGSSTDTADPGEVHRMGAASAREEKPQFEENLKVGLRGHGAASSVPPFGSGEPLHLEIDLTIVNEGNAPVFIVAAALKDPTGRRSIGFSDVCSENEPLQPGGRRKETVRLLHHSPFPQQPWHPRTPEQLFHHNAFTYKLLRFICQVESAFHIETGRGSNLIYPAAEVCDESFLGWPYMMPPKDIEEAMSRKTLEDFENEEREAWEKAAGKGKVDERA